MPVRQLRLALAVFVVLTLGVGGNLLLLQGPTGGTRGEARAARPSLTERERQLALAVPTARAVEAAPARASAGLRPEVLAGASMLEQGDTIRAVQRELQQRGYLAGSPDGQAGIVTRAAVMAWEHDHGLPLTAEPSDRLLKRILLGPGAVPADPPATKAQAAQLDLVIRTVQQSLSGLGYDTGKADGRLGEDTQRAIRDFESDNALPETGRISAHLVAKLSRLAGNGRLTASR